MENNNSIEEDGQVPSTTDLSWMPTSTRSSYSMKPSLSEMMAMDKYGVEQLDSFEIWNQNGSIFWNGPVDLTYVNLDKTVEIGNMWANIYPESLRGTPLFPEWGCKLRKSCILQMKYPVVYPAPDSEVRATFDHFCKENGWTFIKAVNLGSSYNLKFEVSPKT